MHLDFTGAANLITACAFSTYMMSSLTQLQTVAEKARADTHDDHQSHTASSVLQITLENRELQIQSCWQ